MFRPYLNLKYSVSPMSPDTITHIVLKTFLPIGRSSGVGAI